jgi:dynein assembly factor 5, axonemal
LKIVHPVLNEMQDWKEDVRLHSLKLLREIVLHGEKSLAKHFVDISPILCKCCMDADKDVAAEVSVGFYESQ